MTNRDRFEQDGSFPSRRRIPGADDVYRSDRPAPEPQVVEKQVEVYVPAPPMFTDDKGTLWIGRIGLNETGLTFHNNEVDHNEWQHFYIAVQKFKNLSTWATCDYCAYGRDVLGLEFDEIAQHVKKNTSTVEVYASIGRGVSQLIRDNLRSSSLTLRHYRAVVGRAENEQMHWLSLAAQEGWSARRLEAMIKGQTPRKKGGSSGAKKPRKPRAIPVQNAQTKIADIAALVKPDNRAQLAQYLRWLAEQIEG